MQIRPTSSPAAKPTQIGTYDAGLTDLSDKVTIDNKKTFATRAEAVAYAQKTPGAEMVVEQRNRAGKLGFDVYQVTIHDKDQRLKSPTEMKNLSLFDKPLDTVAKASGGEVQRAFFVTEDGSTTANIYNPAFDRTVYDKLRSGLGLDDSKMWFQLVDKYMTAPSPADDIPPISSAEISDMKSKLQTGDIIMTGNNGSFIHAIIYVGEDKALQAQLEKKWNMAPGTLNGEGMIIHSLAADHSAEIEINGKKQQQPAGGTGVIIDTIERYHGRNPRDTMMVVGVKGATEADRKAVVEAGKQMVGRGYDNGFNTFDDRDIYCTEFVYKAWLAAPDSRTDFSTQLHPLVPQTSGPVSGWLYDKVSPNTQKSIQDDGYLYQEMIMTDGIITSPNVELKWVNQNADKSEFVQKHERWAEGMAGNISKGYKDLLQEHIPEQAQRSPALVEQIRTMAEHTRQRMK